MPTSNVRRRDGEGETRMPLITRLLPVSSVDADARTAECTWTAGAQVMRYDWVRGRTYMEELGTDDGSTVRMDRLSSGRAPLLACHNSDDLDDVLGVIDRAALTGSLGAATLRFSRRADVEPIFQDVIDRILANVSVGYVVYRYLMISPDPNSNSDVWTYRAIDWEPYEISVVPVNADPDAAIRGVQSGREPILYPCEFVERGAGSQPEAGASLRHLGATMPEATQPNAGSNGGNNGGNNAGTQVSQDDVTRAAEAARAEGQRAERDRARDIRTAVRATSLPDPDTLIEDYITRGVTADACRQDVLRRMAEASEAAQVRSNTNVQTVRDETDARRAALTGALLHRIGVQRELDEGARQYRGLTLREMCRASLEAAGISTRNMDVRELAGTALGLTQRGGYNTTSDLPVVFGNVIGRTMRDAYTTAPRSFSAWARRGTLSDFRPVTRVMVDGAVKLEKVNESGEYKRGKLVDGGEVIQLGTYGKVVALTRQMIINDDLSALERIPQFFGRAAANLESDVVYGVLTANPAMSDNVTLFHANHKNLAAAGAAMSIASLSAARSAMRVQTAPGDKSPLNLTPKFLLVPAALETLAGQLTSNAYVPNDLLQQNPFFSTLTPVVEPRLDALSTTAWYVMSDPAQIDTVEYSYLEGEEGLYTEQSLDFDVDGLKVKGRLDFAAKAIDYRGMYKNPGA